MWLVASNHPNNSLNWDTQFEPSKADSLSTKYRTQFAVVSQMNVTVGQQRWIFFDGQLRQTHLLAIQCICNFCVIISSFTKRHWLRYLLGEGKLFDRYCIQNRAVGSSRGYDECTYSTAENQDCSDMYAPIFLSRNSSVQLPLWRLECVYFTGEGPVMQS